MTQDLIKQAISIFNNYDKWSAFIELSNSRPEIRRRYFEKLKSGLISHFATDIADSWSFIAPGTEQYRWFLKDYGQESICLLWRPQDLILWCNPQIIEPNQVRDLLNTPEFNILLSCFDNKDSLSNPHLHHFCEERHRYTFDDSTTYYAPDEDNPDKLAWFAGNKTDEFIKQIAIKINRFRTPEMTLLLKQINNTCKKR